MANKINPFHIAIPVSDLKESFEFYRRMFKCGVGRSSDQWIDLDFYGHQLVLHYKPVEKNIESPHFNPVDGHAVPVPHYGVVLDWEDWENLAKHLQNENVSFVIKPYVRFKGEVGEQATMFLFDPSGNALEFKAFKNKDQLFAK